MTNILRSIQLRTIFLSSTQTNLLSRFIVPAVNKHSTIKQMSSQGPTTPTDNFTPPPAADAQQQLSQIHSQPTSTNNSHFPQHNSSSSQMSDRVVKFDLMNGTAKEEEAEEIFQPPASLQQNAHVPGLASYHEMYAKSINNADQFWLSIAKQLHFEQFTDKGLEWNFDERKGEVFIRFMDGAKTNIAFNCLERNVERGLGKMIAFRWEGNEPGDEQSITYEQLLEQVTTFSAVLRSKGVRKGDVVAIYLPMILELPIAMLACARIGAVHSVVFAGFSADSLASRICHARARVLVTADGCFRGNKPINLKALADQAAQICTLHGESLEHCIVVEHLKRVRTPNGASKPNEVEMKAGGDCCWAEEMAKCQGQSQSNNPVEWMQSEDPLFILYTSGSTGAPKGILHTIAGYMVYTYLTMKCSFDAQPENDVYWATADCGWITGHSYVVYGPLLNGMSSIIFEGVPSYPDSSRMWAIVEKYKVTKLYTAPTAVRALMAFPNQMVTKHDRSSLQLIGTVGEPINPSAWKWLYNVVGEKKCAIVDTYWQTETGGHVIVPMPAAIPTKPGSATLPFFGVLPALLDNDGRILEGGPFEGNLCFSRPWPGMMRSIWGDHQRFVNTYFNAFHGFYFTGDGARRDEDGYYWITGRVDDLMNVSGHLLSTAEIESALALHPDIVEAAVVSAPHPIKGQFPYAFVILANGKKLDDKLIKEMKEIVRNKIGAIAIPDIVQEAPGLPKTRSGKVTRRILRKIAEGDKKADLGDISTLIDESVIQQLWDSRQPAIRTNA